MADKKRYEQYCSYEGIHLHPLLKFGSLPLGSFLCLHSDYWLYDLLPLAIMKVATSFGDKLLLEGNQDLHCSKMNGFDC